MSVSSKAADILVETGSSFKRIAELTMELVDPNRLPGSTATPKVPVDSSDLKRLRDALQRFSSDLDGISQRIQSNRENSAASQEVEKLLNPTENVEENNEAECLPSVPVTTEQSETKTTIEENETSAATASISAEQDLSSIPSTS